MQLHELVENSYQAFLQQLQDVRIVLLHPQSRFRSMLVARLLTSDEHKVFYYALGPDDINLHAFLTSICHDLADQHPTFGRHINMLPQEIYENPVDHFKLVLETFIKDLEEISEEPFLLVLDEYDRSDSSDYVQRFVEKLSDRMPQQGKMVINSRTLPRLPWVAMIAQGRAVMLKDDEIIQEKFYGDQRDEGDNMEIYALGPGFVLTNGEAIDNWEGHLPRLLFFFALDRPIITRSEICQAFWPDLDPDQAVNVFHVTKRRLHKALKSDVLVHEDGYYKINPEIIVYYDVMEFVKLLMRGRNAETIEERVDAWQRAVELYRGPFLQGHNDDWIVERREEFRAGYLEALINTAHHLTEQERPEQALTLVQKALEEDDRREDVHQEIMKLYAILGRRGEAAAHYQGLREKMRISPDTETLYKELMN